MATYSTAISIQSEQERMEQERRRRGLDQTSIAAVTYDTLSYTGGFTISQEIQSQPQAAWVAGDIPVYATTPSTSTQTTATEASMRIMYDYWYGVTPRKKQPDPRKLMIK